MNRLINKLTISVFGLLLLTLTSSVPAWALATSPVMRQGLTEAWQVLQNISSKKNLSKAVSVSKLEYDGNNPNSSNVTPILLVSSQSKDNFDPKKFLNDLLENTDFLALSDEPDGMKRCVQSLNNLLIHRDQLDPPLLLNREAVIRWLLELSISEVEDTERQENMKKYFKKIYDYLKRSEERVAQRKAYDDNKTLDTLLEDNPFGARSPDRGVMQNSVELLRDELNQLDSHYLKRSEERVPKTKAYDYNEALDALLEDKTFDAISPDRGFMQNSLKLLRDQLNQLDPSPENLQALIFVISEVIIKQYVIHEDHNANSFIYIFKYLVQTKFHEELQKKPLDLGYPYEILLDTLKKEDFPFILNLEALKVSVKRALHKWPENFSELMSCISNMIRQEVLKGQYIKAKNIGQIYEYLEKRGSAEAQRETVKVKCDYHKLFNNIREDDLQEGVGYLRGKLKVLDSNPPEDVQSLLSWINETINQELKAKNFLMAKIITKIFVSLERSLSYDPEELFNRLKESKEFQSLSEKKGEMLVVLEDLIYEFKLFPSPPQDFNTLMVRILNIIQRNLWKNKPFYAMGTGRIFKYLESFKSSGKLQEKVALLETHGSRAEWKPFSEPQTNSSKGGDTTKTEAKQTPPYYERILNSILKDEQLLDNLDEKSKKILRESLDRLQAEFRDSDIKVKDFSRLISFIEESIQTHTTNNRPNLALNFTVIHHYLNHKNPNPSLRITALPLRIRSFDTAESYHKALSTQPVGVKDQYQKASYYDYRKKELVTGFVQVAKDLPLIGLTCSINGIHTPYISDTLNGRLAEWAANIEFYQAETMKDSLDLKDYLKTKYPHVKEPFRLGAFKTDGQMAGLATFNEKELKELRKDLEGYLEIPAVKEAMQTADDLQISLVDVLPFLGGMSLKEYAEEDIIRGKNLLKAVKDQFIIAIDEALKSFRTHNSEDSLYIALGQIPGTPVEDLSGRMNPSLTRGYA
jgi:hypothetical protein